MVRPPGRIVVPRFVTPPTIDSKPYLDAMRGETCSRNCAHDQSGLLARMSGHAWVASARE